MKMFQQTFTKSLVILMVSLGLSGCGDAAVLNPDAVEGEESVKAATEPVKITEETVKAAGEAIGKGDLKKFQQLVKTTPDLLKFQHSATKITFLHLAAIDPKTVEILKYLIENNLDVNQEDKDGRPPFFYAGLAENDEAILYLMMNGAKKLDRKLGAVPEDFEKEALRLMKQAALMGAHASADKIQDELSAHRREISNRFLFICKNIENALANKPSEKEREKYRLKKRTKK